MNEKDIAEQAYNNGYNQALKDIVPDGYRATWKSKFFEAKKENERLQKQVDELTAFKNEAISMSLYGKGRKDGEAVAVKDTADKIFRQVLKLYQGLSKGERETMTFEWKLLDLAIEYGVEVE